MSPSMIERYFILLIFLLFIQSCSINEIKKGETEEHAYGRIQDLRNQERYILSSLIAEEFKKKFPQSDKLEELDLYVADTNFNSGNWKWAQEKYEKFVKEYPKSEKIEYAKTMITKSLYERRRFHKHADLNYFLGTELLATGEINRVIEAPHGFSHISLSYFFKPDHGIFFGSQNFGFKASPSEVPDSNSLKDKSVLARQRSLGYMHRWKIAYKYNVVYGIAVAAAKMHYIDDKGPNSVTTMGFNQLLTIDYCAFAQKEDPCWNGVFPSIGLFQQFSPNGRLGDKNLSGSLVGLAFGVKL